MLEERLEAAKRIVWIKGLQPDPELDFCDLARGMGVPARRVENAEDLATALAAAFAEPGPTVIEVLL